MSAIQITTCQIAADIAAGRLTAVDAVERTLEQIEKVNPQLNAVCFKRYEEARQEARAADRGKPVGPLHGVPITIKESLDLTGTPSTIGVPSRAHHRALHDHPYVARLREAGAIVVGKTNVAQALIYYESDNPLYGRTNNPHNLERTCGGSTGGEAAIIAAGGSPLGLGTDIGGSVRVPAHFCGVVGFKPTSGRLPVDSPIPIIKGQQAIQAEAGLLARSVEDITLGLSVLTGNEFPPVGLSTLKVAYYTDDGLLPAAPAIERAVLEAADILREAGATVSPWTPPDPYEAMNIYLRIGAADGAKSLAKWIPKRERDPRIRDMIRVGRLSRPTLRLLESLLRLADQKTAANALPNLGHHDTHHYWQAVEAQLHYRERFANALDADLILCPPCALPAFPHNTTRYLTIAGSYSALYNLLGYPAGVVPFTTVQPTDIPTPRPTSDLVLRTAQKSLQQSADLPVGVQLIARPWQEHHALAAMRVIEQKNPQSRGPEGSH